MSKRRRSRQSSSILEVFVDPLFGAFGAFLFIFLMVILMINIIGKKPIVLTKRLTDGFHGEPYEVWLSAMGGAGEYEWVAAKEIPPGLNLDPNGYLHGMPKIADLSHTQEEHQFVVVVTALKVRLDDANDPNGAKERCLYSITIHRDKPIEPTRLTPVKILTTSPLPDGTIGKAYSVALAASGGLPPYTWTCRQSLSPMNLELDTGNGRIFGTPSAETKIKLTFAVTDARTPRIADSQDSGTFEFSVFPPPKEPPPPPPPPEIVTKTLPCATEGLPFEIGLSVRNGAQPFTWKAETIPTWLRMDPNTGIMQGTVPFDARGNAPVSLTLTDSLSRECINPFNGHIEIRPQKGAPINKLVILSSELPHAVVKKQYKAPIAVQGGVPPFRFSSQTPSSSFTVTDDGYVEGTPMAVGERTLEVNVSDSHDPPQQASAKLSLKTREAERPLKILTNSELPPAIVGTKYTLTPSAEGGQPPYKWSVKGNLPKGLQFANGQIMGNPKVKQEKPVDLMLTVSDSKAVSQGVQKKVRLTVLDNIAKPPIKASKWLWLAAVFVVSAIAKKMWYTYCLSNARKYGVPRWIPK
jgi:hypothetical protein